MNKTPFEFEAPENSPGFLLWQTTISWQRLIKKLLEQHDISHAQFVIMALLLWFDGQKREVTQIDLVKISKLDKMTVSKSLKKLVGLGFVKRYENAEDTRAKTVCLATSGKTLIRKLIPMVERIDSNFFGYLQNKEQLNLIKALQKLAMGKDE